MKRAFDELKGVTPLHRGIWLFLCGFCVGSALWALFLGLDKACLLFLALASVLTALLGMTKVET